RPIAELIELGGDIAVQQEVLVLLTAVLVHAAAGVTRALVLEIQRVMRRIVDELAPHGDEARVPAPGAALAAVRRVARNGDAHRNASVAVVAVRPIGERAAAPEADAHELAVHTRIDEVTRRRDLRARRTIGQVAAWIRRRGVELQRRQRKIVEPAHAYSGNAPGVQPPGAAVECINWPSSRAKR